MVSFGGACPGAPPRENDLPTASVSHVRGAVQKVDVIDHIRHPGVQALENFRPHDDHIHVEIRGRPNGFIKGFGGRVAGEKITAFLLSQSDTYSSIFHWSKFLRIFISSYALRRSYAVSISGTNLLRPDCWIISTSVS